jgi:hypothetical protein
LKRVVSASNKTGIYSANPNVSGKADFTASEITEEFISPVPPTGTSLERELRNLSAHSEAFQLQKV